MSDNTPDFDNMSPEEIMAWMETLAKRQGASEGFTTDANMDIAEIDPNTVVIDEPGYVPYGQEQKQPSQSAPPPVSVPEPPSQPHLPLPSQEPAVASTGEGALAWLESLAADQDEELFNLDLSDLPDETTQTPAVAAPPVNPMTWLEDLARSQVAEPSLEQLGAEEDQEEESEKLDPFAAGVNPMAWLETLARRQGAKDEELTTDANLNVPAPPETEVEEDGYQPFSFDTPPTRRAPEPAALENPADWLNSLAGSEGYSEEGVRATQKAEEPEPPDSMSMSEIEQAIAGGTVTREQMQYFLDRQADELASQPEEAYADELEVDEPLAPAELPDWLSELKPQTETPEPTKPIDQLFEAPPASEMPDWLRQDVLSDDQNADLASIFEPDDEESRPMEPVIAAEAPPEIEIDTSDPWVEAFDEEYEQGGAADITNIPEWYEQNVSDPERVAAVEGQLPYEESSALEEAPLPPENGLTAGQPQAVPDWMTGIDQPDQASAGSGVFEEIPDWLKEVEASVSPEDVPDWLVETISAQEVPDSVEPPASVIEPPTPVVQMPAPPPAPAPMPQPQPMPAAARAPVSSSVIEQARDKEQSGDLESALADYELMIRSSTDLDVVVSDLTELVKSYKTTPAVYRVLGDGLMRQGKLQAALNTYREALNQL